MISQSGKMLIVNGLAVVRSPIVGEPRVLLRQ